MNHVTNGKKYRPSRPGFCHFELAHPTVGEASRSREEHILVFTRDGWFFLHRVLFTQAAASVVNLHLTAGSVFPLKFLVSEQIDVQDGKMQHGRIIDRWQGIGDDPGDPGRGCGGTLQHRTGFCRMAFALWAETPAMGYSMFSNEREVSVTSRWDWMPGVEVEAGLGG